MPYWTPGSERHDMDAIRWLFEHEGLAISDASPVQRALVALERVESDAPQLPGQPVLHQFITTKMAQVLGWSIRALWGEGATPGAQIDKTFVKQLLRPDLEGGFALPTGVSVLWTAARWHRESPGEIRICGDKAKGADIVWTPDPPGGVTVHAECKDRAVARSVVEGERDFRRYLRSKLEAGATIPPPARGIRVLIVGFLTSVKTGKALRDRFESILREERRSLLDRGLDFPDAIAGNFIGMDCDESIPFVDMAAQTAFLALARNGAANPSLEELEPLLRRIYGERGRDPTLPFSHRSDERLSIQEDIRPYQGMTVSERSAAMSKLTAWARDVANESVEPLRVWRWQDPRSPESVGVWKRLTAHRLGS